MLAGVLVGSILSFRSAEHLSSFIPPQMYPPSALERLIESPQARADFLAREETAASQNLLFGSYLFAHNTQVGLLSFASGILAGVPSVLLQFYNGSLLGAFSSIFFRDPWPIDFLAWILPHGVPELTAICLCAAAGLLLGNAVARPGRKKRGDRLREAAPSALLLVACALPLFVCAALVESFVRESALGTLPRLAVAAFFTLLLSSGLLLSRRLSQQHQMNTNWLKSINVPDHNAAPSNGLTPQP